MFDSRKTKKEIIDAGMKLHALYIDKCAEIERLRAEIERLKAIIKSVGATA